MGHQEQDIFVKSSFRSDFITFLQSRNLPFKEEGERFFIFPDTKMAICLVCFSDFLQQPDDMLQKPEDLQKTQGISAADLLLLTAVNEMKVGISNRYNPKAILGSEVDVKDIFYLYEDRWLFQKEFVQKHILARLGCFRSVFARKCRVVTDVMVKQSSPLNVRIKAFLEQNHTYGTARCKYMYALEYENEIVAVATFSQSRPMPRPMNEIFTDIPTDMQGKTAAEMLAGQPAILFDSYEWVRYASLPDCRVVGGMGRLLKAFINDLKALQSCRNSADADEKSCKRPIEIMSYSDTEWSQGGVYQSLGFKLYQERQPVEFYVNKHTGERISINKVSRQNLLSGSQLEQDYIRICNCGSRKFLLQLL